MRFARSHSKVMETSTFTESRPPQLHDAPDRGIAFARFMARPIGRGLRIVAGGALIGAGAEWGGTAGVLLAAVGIVPILAGALNLCLLAPIVGAPFRGADA